MISVHHSLVRRVTCGKPGIFRSDGAPADSFSKQPAQRSASFAERPPSRRGTQTSSKQQMDEDMTRETTGSRRAARFGTRLPTTDNTTGLDRDAVDFFATIGGARSSGSLALTAEAGLGIHTTREQQFEQDDLFLYAARVEYRLGPLIPSAAIIGQMHGTTHSEIRGVEDLGELRLGFRAGRHRWVRFEYVNGYERFSPSNGLIVTAGLLH
jgi:hypothetical protein